MEDGPREDQLTLPDGRTLAWAEHGDPEGAVVLGCHGSPSSRLERHVDDVADYRRWGVRLVVPDRPGFGRSDPQPGRRVVDWPADVAGVLGARGGGARGRAAPRRALGLARLGAGPAADGGHAAGTRGGAAAARLRPRGA